MLSLDRRALIGGVLLAPAVVALPQLAFGATSALPPAITPPERLARLAKARALMQRAGRPNHPRRPTTSNDNNGGIIEPSA